MMSPNNRRTLYAGLSIILLTNVIALGGVAYNRAGDPESSVLLTERELRLPYRYDMEDENTGIALRFSFRDKVRGGGAKRLNYDSDNIDWIDKDKLASLGFDVSQPLTSKEEQYYYRHRDEREVILVLEYNGSAYQDALKKAEETLRERQQAFDKKPKDPDARDDVDYARENLESEKLSSSRLFVIDAGKEKEALRKKYPDRSKYLLLKGLVVMLVANIDTDSPYLTGYVRSLSNADVHVPLTGHQVLEPLMEEDKPNRDEKGPRYTVRLNIGQRLEPWVEEVTKL